MATEVRHEKILIEHCLTSYRGLAFTVAGLRRSLNNSGEELSDSFTKAYNETLKKFHSFVVKPLFTVRRCLDARVSRD